MGVEILETLRTLGVTVEVIGPDRLRLKPASKIPPELIARIRQAKPEILVALAVQPLECRHCGGKGECDCLACNLRRTEKAVPCSMCQWDKRQLWLAATRPAECWFCEERRRQGEPGPCPNCAESGKGAAWTQ